jgi:hypothetical protein
LDVVQKGRCKTTRSNQISTSGLVTTYYLN